jgi:hypothetical protein
MKNWVAHARKLSTKLRRKKILTFSFFQRNDFNGLVFCNERLVGWLEGSLDQCNNSAPGLDGIKFILFKFLPEEAKRYLLGIFNVK